MPWETTGKGSAKTPRAWAQYRTEAGEGYGYRNGSNALMSKHKEAINEALKAFESTLKAILDERGWPYDKSRDGKSAAGHRVREWLDP
jgi:hypothetical protein